jgi:phosphopantothenoylcysteine decarboxylase/phosphopantothenate--cysteine ligase
VQTAIEMRDAALGHLKEATVVIKAAAVADYRPMIYHTKKIKKATEQMTVRLERNPDIIAAIGKKKGSRIVVGFAMESDHLLENARRKLVEKGMDFIVANDLTTPGAGFRTDTNIIRILDGEGGDETFPLMDKLDAAGVILDRVKKVRDDKGTQDAL